MTRSLSNASDSPLTVKPNFVFVAWAKPGERRLVCNFPSRNTFTTLVIDHKIETLATWETKVEMDVDVREIELGRNSSVVAQCLNDAWRGFGGGSDGTSLSTGRTTVVRERQLSSTTDQANRSDPIDE